MKRPGQKFTRESLEMAKEEISKQKHQSNEETMFSDNFEFFDPDNNNTLEYYAMSPKNNSFQDIDERINRCLSKIIDNPTFDDLSFETMLRFVQKAHKELKFMTQRMKRVDNVEDEKNDWKFASLVIDRLCLYIFSLLVIGGTGIILFSAPHLIA